MGVSLLLDTHAFFWIAHPAFEVPAAVADAWDGADQVSVSDASAYEVALKVRLGKFDAARQLADQWVPALQRLRVRPLPVTTSHALLAGSLEWAHRDPFDRLIAAQAISEDLTLITADPAYVVAPGVSLLRW